MDVGYVYSFKKLHSLWQPMLKTAGGFSLLGYDFKWRIQGKIDLPWSINLRKIKA